MFLISANNISWVQRNTVVSAYIKMFQDREKKKHFL